MSDSCVVYVNEALYYYFTFIFTFIFDFFQFFFYGFNVSTIDIASTQQIRIQFKRFIYTFKSNQSGIGFAKLSKFLFLYFFH